MELKELKPRQSLNKSFLKIKPNRLDIEKFKANLINLLDNINDKELEEFHKNLVIKFLQKTYYDPNYFINTKGRNDLVIHNGNSPDSFVGVIIEAKKPTNRAEMITTTKINAKAFQELVLYYLKERITNKNKEITYLIATNINEWFIFDATLFERLFAQNKSLIKQFSDFEGKRLVDTSTDFFYKNIAEPFIDSITSEIEYTYFNIQDFQKPLRNTDKADDNALIALFKLLSPEHLLKLPFTNDSNTLDKRFYSELLHIIGLTETKDGNKKLIDRNKEGERNTGTILEGAIIQLDSLDKISRLEKPNHFGNTQQERLFNVALELTITWINRILFLKLLEAQLITYHKGDKSYAFLNLEKIKNYDDLNSLFFQVLAKKNLERNADVKKVFEKIPYLNSSLFEPTNIEQVTLFISNLKDDKKIPIISSSVLKDQQGKKRTGDLPPLEYLFEFLNAYDFSSEGSEEIQEDNKTLISASVLGLIFEKINGYKDGSFFTPGFITMYMCRETIRKTVVQKFNECKLWNCKNWEDLYEAIDFKTQDGRNEANAIINQIKICDPAVGSGHYLVSALNEIIAIKNDLKILQDRNGKRLKEYKIGVVNDELIVTDEEEGKLFEYNPKSQESQRIQEALFYEKQTIIENCLFGVDINSNSVKICRLRLWIELLKNAYYKNGTELETLPNIDINIKCGNSLVSRFSIDSDLSEALKKSKRTIESYRTAVATYRNAESKEQKKEMEKLIADIKSDFRSEISLNDPKIKKLRKLTGDLYTLKNQTQLFEMTKKGKAVLTKKVTQLTEELAKLETDIDEIKNNKVYENSFEWRFEFPEVLDADGNYVGFDCVIGNPPYLSYYSRESVGLQKFEEDFFRYNYDFLKTESFKSRINTVMFFFEKGFKICKTNGILNFIIDFNVLENPFIAIRKYILQNWDIIKIHKELKVFEDVASGQVIGFFKASKSFESFDLIHGINGDKRKVYTKDIDPTNFSWNPSQESFLLDKIELNSKILGDIFELITGVAVNASVSGKDAFINAEKLNNQYYPLLEGGSSVPKSYSIPTFSSFINYDKNLERELNDEFDKNYFENKGSHQRPFNLRKLSDFDRPKIFIRQSDIKVTATYSEDLYFGNYSLFTLYDKDNNTNLLKAYLAILNSKLISFYAIKKEIVLLKTGKTPQLRSGQRGPIGLRQLPLIPLNKNQITEFKNKVEKIYNLQSANEEFTTVLNEIDILVYRLYDLTEDEVLIIDPLYKVEKLIP